MATQTHISIFDSNLQDANAWLEELASLGNFKDEAQAYSGMRAVLHSLRDRLIAEEATHLGSHLPMIIRGIYYEGWKLSKAPNIERTKQQFLDSVSASLHNNTTIDPEMATRTVFRQLKKHVPQGELEHVINMLPKAVREMWPEK